MNSMSIVLGAWPQFTGSRLTVNESYAVQASGRAAAALARRRKQWGADRIMEGRIQGEAVKVKALPVAGNAAIGDNLIQPPPGSPRCAFGQLVNCKELHMRYFN
jgi:hypothetical protein